MQQPLKPEECYAPSLGVLVERCYRLGINVLVARPETKAELIIGDHSFIIRHKNPVLGLVDAIHIWISNRDMADTGPEDIFQDRETGLFMFYDHKGENFIGPFETKAEAKKNVTLVRRHYK